MMMMLITIIKKNNNNNNIIHFPRPQQPIASPFKKTWWTIQFKEIIVFYFYMQTERMNELRVQTAETPV